MRLAYPRSRFKYRSLQALIKQYNEVPEKEDIHQIFLLQKIHYLLNTLEYDKNLTDWVHNQKRNSWNQQLSKLNINPYGSFFLKSYQFANAVAKRNKQLQKSKDDVQKLKTDISQFKTHFYNNLQKRDALFFENKLYKECISEYVKLSCEIKAQIDTNENLKARMEAQKNILKKTQIKLEYIIYPDKEKKQGLGFLTKELEKNVNNLNFLLKNKHWEVEDCKVIRVEDREHWREEQVLHSYPVSEYFLPDYAGFMIHFNKENRDEVNPVVLSKYANQGNLEDIANKLRTGETNRTKLKIKKHSTAKPEVVSSTAYDFFIQLIDFSIKLIQSDHFYPDIKLTNFLVDENRIRISDRKTILKDATPLISQISSTPPYAPPEYRDCLNKDWDDMLDVAETTTADMPAFMAYQLGITLKQFLILTQTEEYTLEQLLDTNVRADSFFTSPTNAIKNYATLIQALTCDQPQQRLTIEQLNRLIVFIKNPTDIFNKLLYLSVKTDELTKLLNSELSGDDLLSAANPLIDNIANWLSQADKIPVQIKTQVEQLKTQTKQLALTCFSQCSKPLFKPYIEAIEAKVLQYDWDRAPWYRKLCHLITFGLWRVDRLASTDFLDNLTIELPSKAQLQRYWPNPTFKADINLNCFGKAQAENFIYYLTKHYPDFNCRSHSIGKSTPSSQPVSDGSRKCPKLDLSCKEKLPTLMSKTKKFKYKSKKGGASRVKQKKYMSNGSIVNNQSKKNISKYIDNEITTCIPLNTGTFVVNRETDSRSDLPIEQIEASFSRQSEFKKNTKKSNVVAKIQNGDSHREKPPSTYRAIPKSFFLPNNSTNHEEIKKETVSPELN